MLDSQRSVRNQRWAMSDATPVKRGLTLAWSIGLGLFVVGTTTVLLLPATKNAGIRFDETQQASPEDDSTFVEADENAKDAHLEDRSTTEQSP
jgi:hypothetical protein